jgi:hypothetical protein
VHVEALRAPTCRRLSRTRMVSQATKYACLTSPGEGKFKGARAVSRDHCWVASKEGTSTGSQPVRVCSIRALSLLAPGMLNDAERASQGRVEGKAGVGGGGKGRGGGCDTAIHKTWLGDAPATYPAVTFNHALYKSPGQISRGSDESGKRGRPLLAQGSVSSMTTYRHAEAQNSFTAYLPLDGGAEAHGKVMAKAGV